MIGLSVRRPVGTTALSIALLVLGVWSLRRMPVELLPSTESPRLTVRASWTGASAEAMEARVTVPLEAAAQRVAGVREVRSESRTMPRGLGASTEIEVVFEPTRQMDFARLEIRQRIAALRNELPAALRGPEVEPHLPEAFRAAARPFMTWRVRGPHTAVRLAELADAGLRPGLQAVAGVASVGTVGGRRREVSVTLDDRRLRAAGLVGDSVRVRLRDLPERRAAGEVRLGGRRTTLAVRSRPVSLREVRDLAVARRASGGLRLADVAEVREIVRSPTHHHRIDGQPVVTLVLHREPGSNALRLAGRLQSRMDTLESALPPGVRVELADDRTEAIRSQLADLRSRAVASAAVVFLVLAIFLRALGPVVVLFAAVGVSVLTAVHLLHLAGCTLNTLTLGGLAWGLGLVVDNAVVVLENIRRRREAGEGPETAAVRATRQVALPVAAATATTAVVLAPFPLLGHELRTWYLPLAWAVGSSILVSLLVALTLVPSMAARLDGGGAVRPGSPGGPEFHPLTGLRGLLETALDHRLAVVVVCLGCVAASGWLFARHVPRGTRWKDAIGGKTALAVRIEQPRGTDLARTDRLVRSFERRLAAVPGVRRVEAHVRPGWAYLLVSFPEELDAAEPAALRDRLAAYGHRLSGVEVGVFGSGPGFHTAARSRPAYAVEVHGFNYRRVKEIAYEFARRMERLGRVRDVDPDAAGPWFERDRVQEYVVRPDLFAMAASGPGARDLVEELGLRVGGARSAGRLRIGGKEVEMVVEREQARELTVRSLRDLRLRSGERAVRVGGVARVEGREVLSRILRANQQYRRTIAWEYRGPRKLGEAVRDEVVDAIDLPPGYRIESRARSRRAAADRRQLATAGALALLFVLVVTAAAFESVTAPLVVLSILPLALAGTGMVFVVTGAAFTRTAWVGTVMTGGIVVNSAILVVHRIEELREEMSVREAILQGTLDRVRPILMTTLTTVLGLGALVLFAPRTDESVWIGLALATTGGLLSSTVFVLTAVPVAYRCLMARGAG